MIHYYLQAFYDTIKNDNALSEEELDGVFVNWNELTMCNMKLLKYEPLLVQMYMIDVHVECIRRL